MFSIKIHEVRNNKDQSWFRRNVFLYICSVFQEEGRGQKQAEASDGAGGWGRGGLGLGVED